MKIETLYIDEKIRIYRVEECVTVLCSIFTEDLIHKVSIRFLTEKEGDGEVDAKLTPNDSVVENGDSYSYSSNNLADDALIRGIINEIYKDWKECCFDGGNN